MLCIEPFKSHMWMRSQVSRAHELEKGEGSPEFNELETWRLFFKYRVTQKFPLALFSN